MGSTDAAYLGAFEADIAEFGIEAEFERKGKLMVAEKPWQIERLKMQAENCRRFGTEYRI